LSEIYPTKIPKIPKKPSTKNPTVHYLRKISDILNKYLQYHGVLNLPLIQEFLITTLDIPEGLDFILSAKNLNDIFTKVVVELSNNNNSRSSNTLKDDNLNTITTGVLLYDFEPETRFEIALKKDEKIEILNKINEDWYYVKKSETNEMGYCPVSYLSIEF
jgi:hypothetical protein